MAERFDEWRLLETIETARAGTAQELVTALADTVCAFQEPSPPVDDITIVAIRRLPAACTTVLDGGLATELEARGHDLSDRLWSARLLLTDPAAIEAVHLAYFHAGARWR